METVSSRFVYPPLTHQSCTMLQVCINEPVPAQDGLGLVAWRCASWYSTTHAPAALQPGWKKGQELDLNVIYVQQQLILLNNKKGATPSRVSKHYKTMATVMSFGVHVASDPLQWVHTNESFTILEPLKFKKSKSWSHI